MSASDEIKKYTRQIQRNPNDYWAYLNRGMAYRAFVPVLKQTSQEPENLVLTADND